MSAVDEVTVCNMALMRIGVGERVVSSDGTLAGRTDSTLAGDHCALIYKIARDEVCTDFPWDRLTGFALLTLFDNGDTAIWGGQWDIAYEYPDDCLRIRKFLTVNTPGIRPPAFAIAQDADGTPVILTDVQEVDANVEFTVQLADGDPVPEVMLAQAVALKLASMLRQPLQVAPDLVRQDEQLYIAALSKAAKVTVNESEPPAPDDGPYLSVR